MPRLQDRALLVRLRIESWGTTRKDDDANRAVAAAKSSSTSATRVSKRLCPEGALKAVKSRADAARTYLREVTQPWTDDGARLLDAAVYLDVLSKLRNDYRPPWQDEVDKVIAQLPEFRDEWGPQNLGDLYDIALYPTEEKMRRQFSWDVHTLPLNPDAKELRTILGNETVDEINAQVEARIIADLWARIAEPIANMAQRLADPAADFKDSLVENVRDIVKLIPSLNLTGNTALADMQTQIEAKLTRYAGTTLRQSRSARSETAAAAQNILATMSQYLQPDDNVLPCVSPAEQTPPVTEAEVSVHPFAGDVLPTCSRQVAPLPTASRQHNCLVTGTLW